MAYLSSPNLRCGLTGAELERVQLVIVGNGVRGQSGSRRVCRAEPFLCSQPPSDISACARSLCSPAVMNAVFASHPTRSATPGRPVAYAPRTAGPQHTRVNLQDDYERKHRGEFIPECRV